MPQELPKRPKHIIRDLLVANWTPANTESYDPSLTPTNSNFLRIHLGAYNEDFADPQISLSQPSGESNVEHGMRGDGTGTNTHRQGTVLVQCWAEDGADYNGDSAEEIVYDLRTEVERIAQNHMSQPTADLWELDVSWDGTMPDDHVPPRWQAQLSATYRWLKEP